MRRTRKIFLKKITKLKEKVAMKKIKTMKLKKMKIMTINPKMPLKIHSKRKISIFNSFREGKEVN